MKLNLPVTGSISVNPLQNSETGDASIYLRADRKNIKVILGDILFIESLKDYIKVVTKEKTIVTKQSISSLEENLPGHLFIRIHRSFIVSRNKIESFTPELIQIGKYELPISRSYRHEVEIALKK
jgi:DNA-binding LytR/AlgR family response regulator